MDDEFNGVIFKVARLDLDLEKQDMLFIFCIFHDLRINVSSSPAIFSQIFCGDFYASGQCREQDSVGIGDFTILGCLTKNVYFPILQNKHFLWDTLI